MNQPDDPPQAGIASGSDDPPQAEIASGSEDPPQAEIASGSEDPPSVTTAVAATVDPADTPEAKTFAGALVARPAESARLGIDLTSAFGLRPVPTPSAASSRQLVEVADRGSVDPLGTTSESSFRFGVQDDAAAAALIETFVVPRYLARAGEMLLELLAVGDSAQIVHVGCGTGFPDALLLQRMPGAELYGCDPSSSAVHLAQSKAAAAGLHAEYLVSSSTSTPLPSGAFTHGLTLDLAPEARAGVFSELHRLLAPGGQLLVTLLLRGSAQELTCLLREYAVASDRADLSRSLDLLSAARPTPEMISIELEAMGFHYVEVEHRRISLSFRSGRDFLEDPVCRMLLFPETERLLRLSLAPAFDHVRTAIDRYWSTEPFELVLSLGCISARRPGS